MLFSLLWGYWAQHKCPSQAHKEEEIWEYMPPEDTVSLVIFVCKAMAYSEFLTESCCWPLSFSFFDFCFLWEGPGNSLMLSSSPRDFTLLVVLHLPGCQQCRISEGGHFCSNWKPWIQELLLPKEMLFLLCPLSYIFALYAGIFTWDFWVS